MREKNFVCSMSIPDSYARQWFSTRQKIFVYAFLKVSYSNKILCTCTNYIYTNKIVLYMYTSCEENVGFALQKSTTDPVKCSVHMNNLCFKVLRRNALKCLSKFSYFLFLRQINFSVRAFVDVNIFCRCTNYLVQLQNIQNVDMFECLFA